MIKLSAPWEQGDEEIALHDHLAGFFWTERLAVEERLLSSDLQSI